MQSFKTNCRDTKLLDIVLFIIRLIKNENTCSILFAAVSQPSNNIAEMMSAPDSAPITNIRPDENSSSNTPILLPSHRKYHCIRILYKVDFI